VGGAGGEAGSGGAVAGTGGEAGAGGEGGAGGAGTGGEGGAGGATSTTTTSTSTGVVEPQCIVDGDCNGANDECRHTTCEDGRCVFRVEPRGTPIDEVEGDCRRVVCDGNGATETVYWGSDVPIEDRPCVGGRCSFADGPYWEPHVAGAPCGDGTKCDGAGNCVRAQPGS
jgi:hypothetical protein